MISKLFAAAAAGALLPLPVAAQSMPGMTMPGDPPRHAPPRPAGKKRAAPSRPPSAATAHGRPPSQHAGMAHDAPGPAAPQATEPGDTAAPTPAAAVQADHGVMDHGAMDRGTMDAETMDPGTVDHGTMDPETMDPGLTRPNAATTMPGMAMPETAMPGMAMTASRPGACAAHHGGACLSQDGSGTARLPGNEPGMHGLHLMAGEWMLMAHGYALGVATDQGGPRGGDEAVVQSMAMLSADRALGTSHLQLRTMLSLEPLMGARGYSNLLATGETANGMPLVDRQHPHDLFMELSARIDVAAGAGAFFVYGGPVAEPALGPSAFMHRGSAVNLPLAPITHHWFDSTHITYGVVTAGYATPGIQIEASAFRGREPDERRWNIESPELDSWSVRASWSPSPAWLVQASHGRLASPEAEHPGEDEGRTTASVQFARGGWATTLAWSLKDRLPGPALAAWLAEANWTRGRHSLFGRIERVANDELFPDPASPLHDRIFRVARFELGTAYRIDLTGPLGLSLGGSLAAHATPAALHAAYGRAIGWTLFARLSLGH